MLLLGVILATVSRVQLGEADPRLEARVSLNCSACGTRSFLKKLSLGSGLAFKVSAEVADEILVVRVQDVRLDDLMPRIADATGAAWIRDGAKYELTRTKDSRSKEAKRTAEQLDTKFKQLLAENRSKVERETPPAPEKIAVEVRSLSESLRVNPNLNRLNSQLMSLNESLPGAHVLRHIMATLTPRDFTALPVDEPYVYATDPTSAQHAMPLPWRKLLGESVAQYAALIQLTSKFKLATSVSRPGMTVELPWLSQFGKSLAGRQAGKIVVEVRRQLPWDRTLPFGGLSLRLYDTEGNALMSANVGLFDPTVNAPAENSEAQSSMRLSGPSAEFSQFIRGQAAHGSGSIELTDRLCSVDAGEPLGLGASEMLLGLAEKRSLQLVACLPDAALFTLSTAKGLPSFTPEEALFSVASSPILDARVEADWLLISPVDPISARAVRADRESLTQLLTSVKHKAVSFADEARFCLANPGLSSSNPLPGRVIMPLADNAELNFSSSFDWFRFLGAIPDSAWKSPSSGLRVANAVPAEALHWLERLVFVDEALQGRPSDAASTAVRGSLRAEPTESFPNGLPDGIGVEVRSTPFISLVWVGISARDKAVKMSPSMFEGLKAGTLADSEQAKLGLDVCRAVINGKCAYVFRRDDVQVTVRVTLTPDLDVSRTLTMTSITDLSR